MILHSYLLLQCAYCDREDLQIAHAVKIPSKLSIRSQGSQSLALEGKDKRREKGIDYCTAYLKHE